MRLQPAVDRSLIDLLEMPPGNLPAAHKCLRRLMHVDIEHLLLLVCTQHIRIYDELIGSVPSQS